MYFEGKKWIRMLPDAPSQTDGQSRFMAAAEDANSVWQKLNADPETAAALTLIGGYDQATFAADVVSLRTTYTTLTTAASDAAISPLPDAPIPRATATIATTIAA